MKQIEAVIFDWAGTTVDYGCVAPIYAMQAAFSQHDVTVSLDEIRKPMGMLKIDHIKAVLAMDTIRNQFQKIQQIKDWKMIYLGKILKRFTIALKKVYFPYCISIPR